MQKDEDMKRTMEQNKKLRLLFVGDSTWTMYANAFVKGAKSIGLLEADLFDLGRLNSGKSRKTIFTRLEYKLSIGPDVVILNKKLISYIKKNHYDGIFFYTAHIISWRTIKKIRNLGIKIAVYCNDNPFSRYYPWYYWRNLIKSVRYSDITYSYRKTNNDKYYKVGAKNVKLLRSYYITDRNFAIDKKKSGKIKVPPVVFLGHMENDERVEYLDALVEKGIEIGVKETDEWRDFARDKDNVVVLQETTELYNEILNLASIAIVFLSKINQDTYTRRCFEIPITGTMMLAPYTSDLASLFEEDKEVVFYRNKNDFVQKVEYYLNHKEKRENIGMAGRMRVLQDGHSEVDRVRQIMTDFKIEFNGI